MNVYASEVLSGDKPCHYEIKFNVELDAPYAFPLELSAVLQ